MSTWEQLKQQVTESQVWQSIFRHGYDDTPRNRVLMVSGVHGPTRDVVTRAAARHGRRAAAKSWAPEPESREQRARTEPAKVPPMVQLLATRVAPGATSGMPPLSAHATRAGLPRQAPRAASTASSRPSRRSTSVKLAGHGEERRAEGHVGLSLLQELAAHEGASRTVDSARRPGASPPTRRGTRNARSVPGRRSAARIVTPRARCRRSRRDDAQTWFRSISSFGWGVR